MVNVLGNLDIDLDVFYKKSDLPVISLGDTTRVTIYLELPKEVAEGERGSPEGHAQARGR